MPTPTPLETPRLRIVPATAELSHAAISDRAAFAAQLGAVVTDQWPPEVLADVEAMFAGKLAEQPDMVGWWGWYIIARAGGLADRDTLVGSIGSSPPDDAGMTMFGYSVLPAFQGRGIGREAAVRFTGWLAEQRQVRLIRADSFEGNTASCRILDRCGLTRIGVSPDDASAPDSDRQGRGTLMRYERRLDA
ncbi:MAG: hypothetical protein AMXMBFR58_32880 [Phycisphaerae bacterium]